MSSVSASAISAVAKAASARVRDRELPPRPSCLSAPLSAVAAKIGPSASATVTFTACLSGWIGLPQIQQSGSSALTWAAI